MENLLEEIIFDSKVSRSEKILAIANAFKDSIGIYVLGMPIRLNEITLVISTVTYTAGRQKKAIKARDFLLVGILLLNLIHTVAVGLISRGNIYQSFFLKYTLRNTMYVMLMLLFLFSNRTYSRSTIEYQCKAILWINVAFFIVLYLFGYRLDLGEFRDDGSYQNFFGMRILRFSGTASEAGYLGPFFMMPLYFYFTKWLKDKRGKTELLLLVIMIFLTFSVITYIMSAITCIVAIKNMNMISKLIKGAIIVASLLLAVICAYQFVPVIKNFIDQYFLDKAKAALGIDGYSDYSGNDRNMHYMNCVKMFSEQSITRKIIGIGTGGYANSIHQSSGFYQLAEEAYNLVLSTLLDRGIIGVIILLTLSIVISRYRIKGDLCSTSIYIGIVSQYLHWMITGNMWLCYFWIEVMYLIGYYRWKTGGNSEIRWKTV